MQKYKATLALTVEADDEAGAKKEFQHKIVDGDFDQDSIELEEVAE